MQENAHVRAPTARDPGPRAVVLNCNYAPYRAANRGIAAEPTLLVAAGMRLVARELDFPRCRSLNFRCCRYLVDGTQLSCYFEIC